MRSARRWAQTTLVLFGTALASLGLAPAESVSAQANPPNPLGQPLLDATGNIPDERFLPAPPLRPEDQRYADLDGDRMKAFLMEVDAISLADRDRGTVFWGRNIGTQGHKDTQAWAERYFRANGLTNIERKWHDTGTQWKPGRWSVEFESGGRTFTLESARPAEDARSTPPDGLEYELVWASTGSDADYIGQDVRDKAVLLWDIPMPGDIRHLIALEGAVQRAFDRGAAAVGVVYGISDNFAMWAPVEVEGSPPGFNVGYEDGMRLREMLGRGERVTVNIKMESSFEENVQEASILGTLPGASDEEILIIAHLDGYFQAASDNGSGLAVMMGLLEHYAKIPQAQRPRTLRFVGSVGHHSGPGTRWFVDERETQLANTVLTINLEHVSLMRTKYWGPRLRKMNAVSPMRWHIWGSERLLDVSLDAFYRFNVGLTADMDPGAAGEIGRMFREVPSIQVISSPEIKHTEQDTPEWVPAVGLEQIARAYAKIIDGVNTLTREELLPATAAAAN